MEKGINKEKSLSRTSMR